MRKINPNAGSIKSRPGPETPNSLKRYSKRGIVSKPDEVLIVWYDVCRCVGWEGVAVTK